MMIMKMPANLIRIGKNFATLNIWKQRVYDEAIVKHKGKEYRVWNPRKSKLCAALHKGLKFLPMDKGTRVLYLGIASGTTASHISDIVDRKGIIYGVEFSPRALRDLMLVCKKRKNIAPILGDARLPDSYANLLEEVDVIYEDVAQPDQIDILKRNARAFLKKDGWIMIAVKARSIDVSKKPKEIFRACRNELEEMFEIKAELRLEPFEKDHAFFVGRMV